MSKSVSHVSSVTTQQTNTTGVRTPILEVDPDRGTLLRFHNNVAKGSEEGIPIRADLQDSTGSQLPVDTSILLRVKRPEDDEPVAVSVEYGNISTYNNLTIAEQQNEENIDATKHDLKADRVNVRDVDTLTVEITSSAQIDWANSELYFHEKAVTEHPWEG